VTLTGVANVSKYEKGKEAAGNMACACGANCCLPFCDSLRS